MTITDPADTSGWLTITTADVRTATVEEISAAQAANELPFDIEVSDHAAEAAARNLPEQWTRPYAPKRGPAAVRVAAGITARPGNASTSLEFSDASRRGPERRELAAILGSHFGIYFERHVTYRTVTVETGCEITEAGHWRATSETREVIEPRIGRGRTDARVSGTPADLARFCAVLPIVLDELDRISAVWGRRCADWLTGDGEHWCTPAERRTAVRHFRRDVCRSLAHALTSPAPQAVSEIDPGAPFPFQSGAVAAIVRRDLGELWLDRVTRPDTEAAYLLAASTAEQLAVGIAAHRAEALAMAQREQAEADLARMCAAEEQRAAEIAADRTELTDGQLAQVDRVLHPRDYQADDEPRYREAPLAPAAAPARAAEPDAAELRERAKLLHKIGAHLAAEVLLARADELDAEQQAAPAPSEELLTIRERPALLRRAPGVPRSPRRRTHRGQARANERLRRPAATPGRRRRSPVRGAGGTLHRAKRTRQTA